MAGEKVLLVDDDKLMLRIISEGLGNEYELIQFTDSEKAMEYLSDNTVHLLLTDYILGNTDGFRLGARAKKLQSNLLVLMMSGSIGVKDALDEWRSQGIVDAFIEKPFQMESLRKLLSELLGGLS